MTLTSTYIFSSYNKEERYSRVPRLADTQLNGDMQAAKRDYTGIQV